jgi:type I restriction enzyme M protein
MTIVVFATKGYSAGARPHSLTRRAGQQLSNGDLNWIANFLWGIADDVLRDLYVRGKYRDVILPMTVLRRAEMNRLNGRICRFCRKVLPS